ncbi:MAG: DUF58 domain-containing protein [Clostridia bacterium]|nr:DUF58 domain-containing protein [Clostridia bacterium]
MWRNRLIFVIAFLCILALYFFENNTGTRILLVATVALPAVSVLLARWASGRVRASLDLPERGRKMEKIPGLLRTGRTFPGVRVYGNVTVVHSFSGLRRLRILCRSTDGTGAFELQEHCGAVEVSLDSVECSDLFGLCSFSRTFPGYRSDRSHLEMSKDAAVRKRICIIEPMLFPVDPQLMQMEELFAEDGERESRFKGPDSFEPDGVREYLPGDRIQSIHWKLSSKADQLLIRENDTLNDRTPLLVLDSRCAEEEIRDALLSAMLSFSNGLFMDRIPHAMGIRGRRAAEAESFSEARDRLLLGELLMDSEEDEPRHASVFLFTDEPEDAPDPDWEGHRIIRVLIRPRNAGTEDLILRETPGQESV